MRGKRVIFDMDGKQIGFDFAGGGGGDDEEPVSGGGGLSTGAKAAIGIVVVVILLAFIGFCIRRHKRRNQANYTTLQDPNERQPFI